MSLTALLLVVVAAFTHAIWNLLAKKAAAVGAPFVAAFTGFAILFYAPASLWILFNHGFVPSPTVTLCIAASGLLHLAYSLVLQRGYQRAPLSVVYPIARGTGPLLSAVGAFILLGETATPGALLGLVLVVAGILLLATGGRPAMLATPAARSGIAWGSATGSTIAAYTVVDGWGVMLLGIHPVLLDWFANLARLLFLMPNMIANRRELRDRMRGYWGLAALVGFLASLGYILVLTALQLGAPLHVVAPAREMSMMVGALLGMIVLGEELNRAKLVGCAMIIAGVVLLAS